MTREWQRVILSHLTIDLHGINLPSRHFSYTVANDSATLRFHGRSRQIIGDFTFPITNYMMISLSD